MFDYELRSISNHLSGKIRSQSLTHSIQLSRSGIPKIHSNILASIETATDKNYNETNVYIQLCFTEISCNFNVIRHTLKFVIQLDLFLTQTIVLIITYVSIVIQFHIADENSVSFLKRQKGS